MRNLSFGDTIRLYSMDIEMLYTLCFCRSGNQLLMLYRHRPPNKGLWNGIGGKIEPNESPEQSIRREICEETGIQSKEMTCFFFAGTVSWTGIVENQHRGMYVYIVDVPPSLIFDTRETPEGILEWKNREWILNMNNHDVVSNIPIFLPPMLKSKIPKVFHFTYVGEDIKEVAITSL